MPWRCQTKATIKLTHMLDGSCIKVYSKCMNKSSPKRRAQILGMMVEGVSIRAISRMTGSSKNTIVKLLADAGNACAEYQDRTLRNLPCKRLQADEIWSFVYPDAKSIPGQTDLLTEISMT